MLRVLKQPAWLRLTIVLAVALGTAVFASSAAAEPPTKTEDTFTGTDVLTGVCAFPVNVELTISGTIKEFFDQNGALTRVQIHNVEQDVFSANGKTLVGLPYTFNLKILFDSSGNITHAFASGEVSRVPLPDGSVFHTAGRADFVDHPGVTFLIQPDHGSQGNLAAFCAALSP
jgi:hypothetical protein